MSRFRQAAETNYKDLEQGFADIVIGTHRIFKQGRPSLRIWACHSDEEQRFGVAHKEK